jgi:CRISPR/Cas system CSM-associated protein Csm2 small subunit
MESASIAAVVTAVLSLLSVALGVKYRKWLEKARLFAELLNEIVAAIEDDEVSEEEFHKIVARAKQVTAKEG